MHQVLNFSMDFSGIILCLLGLMQVHVGVKMERRTAQYFSQFFLLLLLFALSNLGGQLMRGQSGPFIRAALYLTNYLEFALPALLAYLVSVYLLTLMDSERKYHAILLVDRFMIFVHITLLTLSQFNGMYYVIDPNNIYHRNSLYPVSYLMVAVMIVIDLYLMVAERSKLTGRERIAFWIYFLVPPVAMALQLRYYGINFVVYSTIIAALTMYVFILSSQTERYIRQQEENIQLKMDIMLSQIQPHFLYNSLTVIQYLCRIDPPLAEKTIKKFAKYLRGNMDSIVQERPIPFEKELQHTKIYLELEQLRFQEALQVAYDIQCTDFTIPTLTLQPLAENAVRHGIRGSIQERGTVTISSRDCGDHYAVSVSDDGSGFDPEIMPNDGRSHIGLSNVRVRLERLANGKLVIDSKLGQGTTVTILLPKP